MEKRVLIDTWQKVTRDDFLKFGTFTRDSLDTIVGKLLIPDLAFEGFGCMQTGPSQVTVSTGHLFYNGNVFVNDSTGGTSLDMIAHLPAATFRIATVSAYGTEIDAELEARTFLTDADTRATVARETATEHWRWANIAAAYGMEGPDPQPPALAANVCPLAYVKLSTTGVVSITRADDYVVPTLREEDNRLNEIDIWRLIIGTRLDTLASDLLALAAKIIGLAKYEFVQRVAADLARTKDLIRIPELYTAWGADHFLATDKSDITNVAWLAKIEEGVRFPPAAGFDAQLGLLNPFDNLIINSADNLLPAWTSFKRVSNLGTDSEIPISTYQYQTTSFQQLIRSRQVTRYGTPFMTCSNAAWWQEGTYDPLSGIFQRAGETFQVIDATQWDLSQYFGIPNHTYVRLQQVWTDTISEPYWNPITNNFSVAGSIVSETFVNSQDGWLTDVTLYFSRVAATGDVTVLLCQLSNGAPDITHILSSSTVTAGNLKTSPAGENARIGTVFNFVPTFLKKDRFGIIVVTGGNHYLWALDNTNLVAGTLFYSTDGAWFQGDLTKDLAFELGFAKFASNQTRVQLQALQLQNGIAAIELNVDAIVPDSCQLFYEIQIAGVWHALDNVDGGPSSLFVGLPPLLPFRAVFVGTEWLQPSLGVAANSRVTTWRPRADFCHISTARMMPSAIHTLTCNVRVEAWLGAPYHVLTMKLLSAAGYLTQTAPTTISSAPAQDDPTGALIYTYGWTGLPALMSYKFQLNGTTNNVLTTYHVAERIDVAS